MNVRKCVFSQRPVEGCSGGGKNKFGIHGHFCLRYPTSEIMIEEGGVIPKCKLCRMRNKHLTKGVGDLH